MLVNAAYPVEQPCRLSRSAQSINSFKACCITQIVTQDEYAAVASCCRVKPIARYRYLRISSSPSEPVTCRSKGGFRKKDSRRQVEAFTRERCVQPRFTLPCDTKSAVRSCTTTAVWRITVGMMHEHINVSKLPGVCQRNFCNDLLIRLSVSLSIAQMLTSELCRTAKLCSRTLPAFWNSLR